MGILTSLDAVQNAERLVDAIRLADDLAFEASRDSGVRTIRILRAALASDNQVVAIAATHALAGIFDEQADVAVSQLLSSDHGFLREHAAWALGSRLPRFDAVARLIQLVATGGFAGMISQRTLEQWSQSSPEIVGIGLESALLGIDEPTARYRVVETLGLVRAPLSLGPLLRIGEDPREDDMVRVAAVSALGQRQGSSAVAEFITTLARGNDFLADVARLSQIDLTVTDTPPREGGGLTVAQLFLHADIDAELSQVGSGDNGGIATLLVRLGNALLDSDSGVDRVITMSRGTAASAIESMREISAAETGHLFGRVPPLGQPVAAADAWPLRVAVRRGIRRLLTAAGGVDVLHLRMADVASLAAADVARELDIPLVFTVAPDPHAVIDSLDKSGQLTRYNFGDTDEREHFWFRARLVQTLAANADHTVLFPRPDLQRDMQRLVGIDITAHPERHSIVPEGIDLAVIDNAVSEAADFAAGQPTSSALDELERLLLTLPEERRGLPLLVSVGRFHRVKGMATVVEAWARGPLADKANLLLIGGKPRQPLPRRSPATRRDGRDRRSRPPRRARTPASPATSPTTPPHDGSLQRGSGCPGSQHLTASTSAAVSKKNSASRCSKRWRPDFSWWRPTAAAPRRMSPTGSPASSPRPGTSRSWRESMGVALELAGANAEQPRLSRATVEASFTIEAMAKSLASVYFEADREQAELREWSVPSA